MNNDPLFLKHDDPETLPIPSGCEVCASLRSELHKARISLEQRQREIAQITLKLLQQEDFIRTFKHPEPDTLPHPVVGALIAGLQKIFKPRKKRRQPTANENFKRNCRLILESGLFDAAWYLGRYHDVVEHGLDPVEHYLRRGANEGRDPSPHFQTLAYLENHPELDPQEMNPLVHHILTSPSSTP